MALVLEAGTGGAFRHVEGLCYYFMNRGMRVHLAFSDKRTCDDLWRLVERIWHSGGSVMNLGVGAPPEMADLLALYRLRAWVRNSQAQIVHAHGFKAGALARCLGIIGVKIPIFYSPHAYDGLEPDRRVSGFLYNGMERLLGRIGHTLNASDTEADFALRVLGVPPEKLSTIPNGVDVEKFRPATLDERNSVRRELGLPPNALILGNIGRVSLQKDTATLYRAFVDAAMREQNLYLYHLGEVTDHKLEAQIQKIVKGSGMETRIIRENRHEDTSHIYRALDSIILTSRYEGLSMVLLEALASGLPLILSEAPGNIDLKMSRISGAYWAPVGKQDDFTSAILAWARNPHRPNNHRRVAVETFRQETCFSSILKHYEAAFDRDAFKWSVVDEPMDATIGSTRAELLRRATTRNA